MSSGRLATRVSAVSVAAAITVLGLASSAAGSGTSGSTPAVSPHSATGQGTLTRIAGADRYQTAVDISNAAFPTGAPTAVVVSGIDFPDGLAAGL